MSKTCCSNNKTLIYTGLHVSDFVEKSCISNKYIFLKKMQISIIRMISIIIYIRYNSELINID